MNRLPILAALAACGSPSPPPVETPQRHETRAAARTADVDLTTLSPATIDHLDDATARGVLDRLGDRAPAARVALRAARLAYHRGDVADARALVARANGTADEAAVHDELAALAAALASPPVDPSTIAVLLPLSGRFAGLGAELRAAIELAPADGTHWLFLDTRGEPDGAVAAVDAALAKGAVAIVGPVGAREVLAAARAAALRDLPIALLGPQDGADAAAGVFRLVDSPADEGRAVAQLAKAEHFPTVGVLAPRDDVGAESADAFVAEAEQLGLQVVANATYDPTGGDVEPDIRAFLNLVPANNPRLAEWLAHHDKKHTLQTFTPDAPYSLLYIPDRYDRAAIVAAFLPYYGVELHTSDTLDTDELRHKHGGIVPPIVQLVGGAGWHHDSLPKRGGDAVQGALIVDAFAGAQGGDAAAQFASAFQQKTGRPPSTAAAEAYDAATLVAAARASIAGGPEPRAEIRHAIARGRLADGACGPAAMDVDGELARTPTVLEVQGDDLVIAP
ncbi:MAG TPA: penicillin-binding protein activator [Kofleriaceae bacterium]|jgi:ABC-type branched-subunit amino acid transport system substrate-binding protein